MTILWMICVISLAALCVAISLKKGPRQAVGISVLLSFLVPVWVEFELLGQPINVRVAIGIFALCLYLFHHDSTIRTKLIWTDFAVFGMVLVHFFSDTSNDGFSLGMLLQVYGEWLLPYFAGRVAVKNMDDLNELLPYGVSVVCVLGGVAIIEALCRINLLELVAGIRPLHGFAHEHIRWGIRRSYGPTVHPIYFGALLLLLFPLAIYGASRAFHHKGPGWWQLSPWLCGLGIMATGSRAPILCLMIAGYVTAVLHFSAARKNLITAGCIILVLGGLSANSVIKMVHRWGEEESRTKRLDVVVVDGEKKQMSGALSRIRLLEVYGPAMKRAGLLGFGTEATTGFPVNVPVGPQHVETLKKVRYIDNAYVLMILRFGYLGVLALAAIGISVTVGQITLSQRKPGRGTLSMPRLLARLLDFNC